MPHFSSAQTSQPPSAHHIEGMHYFGRRQGRPLSALRQRALERLPDYSLMRWIPIHERAAVQHYLAQAHIARHGSPVSPAATPLVSSLLTPAPVVWLEIGFGQGHHMLEWLAHHPQQALIGCEVFVNGIAHVLTHITPETSARCSIFPETIGRLWPLLPYDSLEGVMIFFPDPWHKKKHVSRRLMGEHFLTQCALRLKPGGWLYFASDHVEMVRHSLCALEAHPTFTWHEGVTPTCSPQTWPTWPQSWPRTKYQQRAERLGHPCAWSIWQRTSPRV